MIDKKLLSILVCPVSKGALVHVPATEAADGEQLEELQCRASGLAYPVRDGIPVMLEAEARSLTEAEIEALAKA